MFNNEILFSKNTEQCVIGCMACDEAGADAAATKLKEEQFYFREYGLAFRVFAQQRQRNIRPDECLAAIELAKLLEVTEPEAALLLLDCMQTVAHAAHVDQYLDEFLSTYQRRTSNFALRESLQKLTDPNTETVEVLSDAVEKLQAVIADGIHDGPRPASHEFVTSVTTEEVATIATGFFSIDQLTGGLSLGTLVVPAARPGMGKTAGAIAIGIQVAKRGSTILFFTQEMDSRSIKQRIGSIEVGVPFSSIRDGRLGDRDRAALDELQSADWMQRFLIDDQPRTVDEMAAITRLYARRFGVKVVIVDYLQLVPPTNIRQPREQQVAEISRKLKQMAKSAGVAVLCLAQLNREVEKRDVKRPKISDLRESGSIEQDADQVWLLWRPNKDSDAEDDHAELIVAKSRNGQTGTVKLAWHGPSMTYSDAVATCDEPEMPDEWK